MNTSLDPESTAGRSKDRRHSEAILAYTRADRSYSADAEAINQSHNSHSVFQAMGSNLSTYAGSAEALGSRRLRSQEAFAKDNNTSVTLSTAGRARASSRGSPPAKPLPPPAVNPDRGDHFYNPAGDGRQEFSAAVQGDTMLLSGHDCMPTAPDSARLKSKPSLTLCAWNLVSHNSQYTRPAMEVLREVVEVRYPRTSPVDQFLAEEEGGEANDDEEAGLLGQRRPHRDRGWKAWRRALYSKT